MRLAFEHAGRILLVEDSPEDAELTFRALRRSRVLNPIDHVVDGAEALAYLFGTNGKRDAQPLLMLLDLRLPKHDGHEILQRLRLDERLKNLPVIVLTCSWDQEEELRRRELRTPTFLRKPMQFGELGKVLSALGLGLTLIEGTPQRKSIPID